MTIATKNEDEYYQQKKHLRKRRANLLRFI